MKEIIIFLVLAGCFVVSIALEHLYTYWQSRKGRNENPNDVFLP